MICKCQSKLGSTTNKSNLWISYLTPPQTTSTETLYVILGPLTFRGDISQFVKWKLFLTLVSNINDTDDFEGISDLSISKTVKTTKRCDKINYWRTKVLNKFTETNLGDVPATIRHITDKLAGDNGENPELLLQLSKKPWEQTQEEVE